MYVRFTCPLHGEAVILVLPREGAGIVDGVHCDEAILVEDDLHQVALRGGAGTIFRYCRERGFPAFPGLPPTLAEGEGR